MNRSIGVTWLLLCALLLVAGCVRTDSPRYQLVRGQDHMVIRLDTHTGELRAFLIGKDYGETLARSLNLQFVEVASITPPPRRKE
jgi:hypothetical protein